MPGPQQKKNSKRRDERPARARYWASKTLEKRKVRRLMKQHGLERLEATEKWKAERRGRVKGGVR